MLGALLLWAKKRRRGRGGGGALCGDDGESRRASVARGECAWLGASWRVCVGVCEETRDCVVSRSASRGASMASRVGGTGTPPSPLFPARDLGVLLFRLGRQAHEQLAGLIPNTRKGRQERAASERTASVGGQFARGARAPSRSCLQLWGSLMEGARDRRRLPSLSRSKNGRRGRDAPKEASSAQERRREEEVRGGLDAAVPEQRTESRTVHRRGQDPSENSQGTTAWARRMRRPRSPRAKFAPCPPPTHRCSR